MIGLQTKRIKRNLAGIDFNKSIALIDFNSLSLDSGQSLIVTFEH